MERVIPYLENILATKGGFVLPNNKIVFVQNNHDEYASEFCFKLLRDKLELNFTRQELDLYKYLLTKYRTICGNNDLDFLVLCLGFDKIETILSKTITTTSMEPFIKFYNYYLMDWDIEMVNKLVYAEQVNKFLENKIISIESINDREAKEELDDLRIKILKKEKYYLFK